LSKSSPAQQNKSFAKFVTISKIDEEQRIVYGIASSPNLDTQDDEIPSDTMLAALDDFMVWANLREMHQPSAVGVVVHSEVKEEDGNTYIAAKVVDDTAWQKVKEGVYKGFSIAGKILKAVTKKLPDGTVKRIILVLKLSEISLVDRPANEDCKILLWKGVEMEVNEEGQVQTEQEQTTVQEPPVQKSVAEELDAALAATLSKVAAVGEQVTEGANVLAEKAACVVTLIQEWHAEISKAINGKAKNIVTQIQALRNQYELDGDTVGAGMMTQAIAHLMQATAAPDAMPEMPEMADMQAEPEAGVEAPADGEDPEKAQKSAAANILSLVKAGRTISSANLSKMQQIHDYTASMGATCKAAADAGGEGGGDGVGDQGKTAGAGVQPVDAPAQPDEIAKGVNTQVTKVLDAFQKGFDALDARLKRIEAQPAGGGPVLSTSVANKGLTGGSEGGQDRGGDDIASLEKMFNETSNPFEKSRLGEIIASKKIRSGYGFAG
jgi:Putative phage serine protease XkdF